MLRLVINFLILLLLIRLMQPLLRGVGRFLKRVLSPQPIGGTEEANKKVDYSELTPYEIEDAEYEEIREKGE